LRSDARRHHAAVTGAFDRINPRSARLLTAARMPACAAGFTLLLAATRTSLLMQLHLVVAGAFR
jgi:hypothetical protein